MLIYNITLKVEWTIQKEWLQWMQETYIEALKNTGCFTHQQLVRLLEVDEDEGPTYALQLYVTDKKSYNNYIQMHLSRIQKMSYDKWGSNVLSFNTLMEIVQ